MSSEKEDKPNGFDKSQNVKNQKGTMDDYTHSYESSNASTQSSSPENQ